MAKKIAKAPDEPTLLGLVYTRDEITVPPFSREGAREAAFLIRQLRQGVSFSEPHWKPMLSIGRGCGELRLRDGKSRQSFRIIYYRDKLTSSSSLSFPRRQTRRPRRFSTLARDDFASISKPERLRRRIDR
ncbi:MAG TPA: hypothetical protein VGN57_08200 [Pirellulaceae bacterium]|nr:hypothetical protein [Pirellulaceae bacterium]